MTNALPGGSSYTAQTYEEMLAQGGHDDVIGHDLTEKESLLSVPMMVTRVAFRGSVYEDNEYVSVEATAQNLGTIVYNDGSTGIRRQVLEYLMAKGIATPSEKCAAYDNPADASVLEFEWTPPATVKTVSAEESEDGNPHTNVTVPVLLNLPRGLRKSEYTYTDPSDNRRKPATTYYFG